MSRRSNPFDELERMIDRMSSQFERNLGEWPVGADVAVDVEERDEEYVVTADLPGYDRDDIEVELADDHLYVSAARETEREESQEGRYIRRERRRESVSRSIRLPGDVAESEVTAAYQNGVLTVTLPKAGASEDGHRIDIE